MYCNRKSRICHTTHAHARTRKRARARVRMQLCAQDNEIAYNNYAGFRTGWEAGAGKLGRTDNDGGAGPGHDHAAAGERTEVSRNFVHSNLGRGLWAVLMQ